MAAVSTSKSKTNSILVGAEGNKVPQQGRSRASYERMLTAAEALMIQRGDDEFALTDVAKMGKVSISSIYLRFSSKDDLIGAVHRRVMARLEQEQDALLADVVAEAKGLDDYARLFIHAYAELLRTFSPVLRPIMFRAAYDATISSVGRHAAERLNRQVQQQLLAYSAEFGRSDHLRLVENAFRMIYCTLARFLGLGSSPESANEGNWEELKEDLAIMCPAFLRARV